MAVCSEAGDVRHGRFTRNRLSNSHVQAEEQNLIGSREGAAPIGSLPIGYREKSFSLAFSLSPLSRWRSVPKRETSDTGDSRETDFPIRTSRRKSRTLSAPAKEQPPSALFP